MNFEDGGLQIFDLDGYYSLAMDDSDVNDGPIACILPLLISSFYFFHEEELEMRCLSIIMRFFNQR